MKKFLISLILICIAAVGVVTFIEGRAQTIADPHSELHAQADRGCVCVYYANTFLSIDQDGIVCENNSRKPEGLPMLEGMEFTKIPFGKKAQPVDDGSLEYALKVASCLDKHGIEADRLSYYNRMISIYIGNLEIQLGKNDKTEEKINDLYNFIDKIAGSSGTLYMQNANANNYGYTFRAR